MDLFAGHTAAGSDVDHIVAGPEIGGTAVGRAVDCIAAG